MGGNPAQGREGWNRVIFEVLSNPSHSMILWIERWDCEWLRQQWWKPGAGSPKLRHQFYWVLATKVSKTAELGKSERQSPPPTPNFNLVSFLISFQFAIFLNLSEVFLVNCITQILVATCKTSPRHEKSSIMKWVHICPLHLKGTSKRLS